MLPGWTKADIIGSPYAVVNYSLNTELGLESDLKNLRTKLNSMGMLLMLDFVPNHSAVDCMPLFSMRFNYLILNLFNLGPWRTAHPEYYVRAPPNTQPPYNPNVYLPNGVAYGNAGGGSPWM